jgi:hypothetical protein
MSVSQLSTAFLFVLLSFTTARVAAQAGAPSGTPAPSQAPATPAPAAAGGTPGGAPVNAGQPNGDALLVPADELQVPREPPPPSNPYPTNPGVRPRRWTSSDVARVRMMLEAERVRRGQLRARARDVSRPPPRPAAAVVHGDAGAAIGLGLSVDAIFHHDVGFRLFDQSKANSRLGLWASHDLATLRKRWILSGELGFGVEANDGTGLFDGSVSAHLRSSTFHGAVSVRWDACSIFAPHVRASGGASAIDLELEMSDGPNETDSAVSGFGALGAGFLLHTPARAFENRAGKFASLSLGFMFEAGYALRSPVDFALKSRSATPRSIEIVSAKLGRLDLSGPYLRTSLVARF